MPTRGTETSPVPVLGTPRLRAHANPTLPAPTQTRCTRSVHTGTRWYTIKKFPVATPPHSPFRVLHAACGSFLRKTRAISIFPIKPHAISKISMRTLKNLRPFTLFHFVPLCSAKISISSNRKAPAWRHSDSNVVFPTLATVSTLPTLSKFQKPQQNRTIPHFPHFILPQLFRTLFTLMLPRLFMCYMGDTILLRVGRTCHEELSSATILAAWWQKGSRINNDTFEVC